MENKSKGKAVERIYALLDERSFVEIGQAVTARSTDFQLDKVETPSDGVVTGYGLINGCPGTWWFHRRNACKKDRKSL